MIVHVLRKPVVGTVAQNALTHGCGALNIDGCRVASSGEHMRKEVNGRSGGMSAGDTRQGAALGMFQPGGDRAIPQVNTSGRWPANLILSHLPGCRQSGTKQVAAAFKPIFFKTSIGGKGAYGGGKPRQARGYGDETGHENVADWQCVEGCPCKDLDEQTGDLHSQTMNDPGDFTDLAAFVLQVSPSERGNFTPFPTNGSIRMTSQVGSASKGASLSPIE